MSNEIDNKELLEELKKWVDFYKPHIHNKELPYWLPKDERAHKRIVALIKSGNE